MKKGEKKCNLLEEGYIEMASDSKRINNLWSKIDFS